MIEIGEENLLALRVSLVPHTERPNDSARDLERALREMTEPNEQRAKR